MTLKQIIKGCGVAIVASELGISQRAVYKWLARGCLPRTEFTGETDYSSAISALTGGEFSRDDVRSAGLPVRHPTQAANR